MKLTAGALEGQHPPEFYRWRSLTFFSLLYSFVTVFSLVSHLAVVSVTATNAKHSIKRMKEIPGDQQES